MEKLIYYVLVAGWILGWEGLLTLAFLATGELCELQGSVINAGLWNLLAIISLIAWLGMWDRRLRRADARAARKSK